MKTLKNMFNTKRKKLLGVAVAIVFLIIACVTISANNHDSKTYDTVVHYVCEENYDTAREYIEQLPENYKDTAVIIYLIDLIENFDESDKESYSEVLGKLEKAKLIESDDILDVYNSFKTYVAELENQYQSDKSAAELITQRIADIADGNINNISLDDEANLASARLAYDESSESVKELVENYDFLDKAEQRVNILKKYKASADEVSQKIENIGTVTLNSENAVNSAYEAYENLSAEAKAFVTNSDILVSAKEQLDNLKTQKAKQEKEKQNKQNNSNSSNYGGSASSGTVYWVSSGEVYHISRNCSTLSRSKNIHSGSAPSGRRPCKVCS